MDPNRSASELQCPWVHLRVPSEIIISGVEVQGCLMQTGSFSVPFVDAIMTLWTHLDDKMHDEFDRFGIKCKRWRHFLPASFAVFVRGKRNFLASDIIRQSFIGDHLQYSIEDCQIIVAPVLEQGRWSCYFWDFKMRAIYVLDPLLMNLDPSKSRMHHEYIANELHHALVSCQEQFFSGWHIDSNGWSKNFLTKFPPKCKISNTGLYSVHYARSFTGDIIAFELNDSSKVEKIFNGPCCSLVKNNWIQARGAI